MFGKKKKAAAAAKPEDEEDQAPEPEVEEEAGEGGDAKPAPVKKGRFDGVLGLILTGVIVTLVAACGGFGLGKMTSAKIAETIADREAAKPLKDHPLSLKVSGDMVLQTIEPVVTNLASPSDTWIRLETAMVFKNGDIANPTVTAAELRQDMIAYVRTVGLSQLEGPSALQHLRDDLNERAALRTNGAVSELIIQTMVVQ